MLVVLLKSEKFALFSRYLCNTWKHIYIYFIYIIKHLKLSSERNIHYSNWNQTFLVKSVGYSFFKLIQKDKSDANFIVFGYCLKLFFCDPILPTRIKIKQWKNKNNKKYSTELIYCDLHFLISSILSTEQNDSFPLKLLKTLSSFSLWG